jgi:hypothetical protein
MKNSIKVSIVVACAFIILSGWGIYALFHGFFDQGTFEVKQSQLSPSKQLAVVGRRSDHQALSGDQYFVIIGDRPFSSADLKHAYYHDGLVFRAGSDCLTIQWMNTHELAVRCADSSIQMDEIAVQRKQVGDVTISYENIPQYR